MKSESEVQQLIQIEGPAYKCILMRNNSGAFKSSDGRWVRFGLGNVSKKHQEEMKSSDLIGITSVTITPDMVGKTIGVFTAIEAKEESWVHNLSDKRAEAQENFIKWVRIRGGLAGFANSVASFKKIINSL